MKYVRFDGEIIIDVYYKGTQKKSPVLYNWKNCSLYRVEIFAIFF